MTNTNLKHQEPTAGIIVIDGVATATSAKPKWQFVIPANDNHESAKLPAPANDNFPLPLTDPKELSAFIAAEELAVDAAQALLKKPSISVEEYRVLHRSAKDRAIVVLDAALRLAAQISAMPKAQGRRTDLISDVETNTAEQARTKKEILKDDYGLSETQAWRISKLTDDAVRKEKTYADENDELPTVSHALSFVVASERKLEAANKKATIFASRNRTEAVALPDGRFDTIYADFANLSDDIKSSIADSAAIFLWSEPEQLSVALDFIKSLDGFEYRNCLVAVKEKIKPGRQYFSTTHRHLLLATRGDYPKPFAFCAPSVCYECEHAGGEVEYGYGVIQQMYPDGAYLDLIADEQFNDRWRVCAAKPEAQND
ncbi:MAG: hypothetical protein FWF97_04100 [Alphaproteobacteria bacterium]|nr:hypothetical protein [Alphaproteobacteria bacterium]